MIKNKILKVRIDEESDNAIKEYCLSNKINNKSDFVRELIDKEIKKHEDDIFSAEEEVIDLTSIGAYKYTSNYKKPYHLKMADKINNALYYIRRRSNINNINMENLFDKIYTKLIIEDSQYLPIIRVTDKYNIRHEFSLKLDSNKKEQLIMLEIIIDSGKEIPIKNEDDIYDIINYYTDNKYLYSYIHECIINKKEFIDHDESMNINISIKQNYIKINTFILYCTIMPINGGINEKDI